MNKKDIILPVALVLAALLAVGGFIALKHHKDKVAPTPAPVAVVEAGKEYTLVEGKGYRGWIQNKYLTMDAAE